MARAATVLFFLTVFAQAQVQERVYFKHNLLLLPLGVVNTGLEFRVGPRHTVQADVLVSPWKSFAGEHAMLFTVQGEGRYYFRDAFKGFYLGVNAGAGVYNFTKWGHWRMDQYQRGFAFMAGGTVGWQVKLEDYWNLDIFVGGGMVQSQYHGYQYVAKGRVIRYDGANGWNKSGEILPYRGGIMLSYRLK